MLPLHIHEECTDNGKSTDIHKGFTGFLGGKGLAVVAGRDGTGR